MQKAEKSPELNESKHVAFDEISHADLPDSILDWGNDNFSHSFQDRAEISKAYKVHHHDGSLTYVVQRTDQIMPQAGDTVIGRRVFFIDYVGDQRVGFLEVDTSAIQKPDGTQEAFNPRIEKNHTVEAGEVSMRRRGFATRRLKIAQDFLQQIQHLGRPIHSGYLVRDESGGPWRQLVKEGLAEELSETAVEDRYRMKI